MSKKFKNLRTGLIEEVFNKDVIAQCEKHPEAWGEVKEKASKEETKEETKKNNKEEK